MAKWRNISGVARRVGYGCPVQTVQPDGVLHVIDEAAISYANQPTIWSAEDKAAQDAEDEFMAAVTYFHPAPAKTKSKTRTEPAEEPTTEKETAE